VTANNKGRPPSPLVWLRELRAPFFTGTVVPAVFGALYARYSGAPFSWPLFGLTVLGTVLVHAGLNMANDYFDHRSGNDQLTVATPFSGGSKVIQEGLLTPRQVLSAAAGCTIVGAGIGVYLNFVTGSVVILLVGALGLVFAWFYEAPPLKLGHRRGLGEIACLLGCGPVIVLGAYFVQARAFSWSAVLAGLPIGLLMMLVLFINEFHDRSADAAVGKNTLVVVLGTTRSAALLWGLLAANYALLALLVATRVLPATAFWLFLTVPLALFAALRARRFRDDSSKLLPANLSIILLHLTVGAGMIVTVAA
jgi:1,4-dihydroxy-2-naphthoate octaprenyltransferase